MVSNIKLPVEIQNDFCTYVFHALPLCVLKTHENYTEWTIENLINCCYNKDGLFLYENQIPDFLGSTNELFICEGCHTDKPLACVCDEIKAKLLLGQYCYILLDEYYLKGKKAYHNYHFIHDSLIYEINNECGKLYAITHFDSGKPLQYIQFEFDEVAEAYAACFPMEYNNNPYFFSINAQFDQNIFCPDIALNNLILFLNSEKTAIKKSMTLDYQYCSYGIESIITWRNNLQEKRTLNYLDFRNAHFLWEQKKNINRAIQYLSHDYNKKNIEASKLYQYENVVRSYEMIRMLFLKNIMQPNMYMSQERMKQDIFHIIKMIDESINMEREALLEITEQLKKSIDISKLSTHESIIMDNYSSIPDLAKKAVVDETECDGNSLYHYHKKLNLKWNQEENIRCILLFGGEYVEVKENQRTIRRNMLNGSQPCYHEIAIDKSLCDMQIDFYANSPVILQSYKIKVLPHSLTYHKKIRASSCWSYSDGLPSKEVCPENAIDYIPIHIWDARQDFNGDEFLEVDFEEMKLVRKIIVGERFDTQRIVAYQIFGYQENKMVFLAEHQGYLDGRRICHEINPAYFSKIKLVINKTKQDAFGYSEPGISFFEVYC